MVRERLDLDAVVVAAPEDVQVDGSRAGIGPGGSYTVRQLLAGLLLNSGNDTANALARTLGGVPAALEAMQAKASTLGALDTRPGSVSGLDGPGMSTSAYDLAVLFRVALRDPTIRELVGTRSVPFPGATGLPRLAQPGSATRATENADSRGLRGRLPGAEIPTREGKTRARLSGGEGGGAVSGGG
ncbi:MAG: hypothetical protein QOJ30_4095 [Pseudonocardiales bacterium]|nr:hypothetical protein [Pseudonocardiales bacterium]